MLLSKTCVYGLRASLFVATMEERKFVPIREISEKLDISFHFLTKILQILTQNDIMHSYRGPNGGVSLSRPAEQITILEIISAIDGMKIFQQCILGLPGCGEQKPCPLHDQWAETREELKDMFAATSLANLAVKIRNNDLRLTDINVSPNPIHN
ncbi:MAG: Rrf2 family transcriptional regulator [Calditrichia bacterium]